MTGTAADLGVFFFSLSPRVFFLDGGNFGGEGGDGDGKGVDEGEGMFDVEMEFVRGPSSEEEEASSFLVPGDEIFRGVDDLEVPDRGEAGPAEEVETETVKPGRIFGSS